MGSFSILNCTDIICFGYMRSFLSILTMVRSGTYFQIGHGMGTVRPPVICDLFVLVPWRVAYDSLDCSSDLEACRNTGREDKAEGFSY